MMMKKKKEDEEKNIITQSYQRKEIVHLPAICYICVYVAYFKGIIMNIDLPPGKITHGAQAKKS